MSTSRDSCCLPSVKKQKHDFQVFAFVQCIIKQLLDSVFVISRIIKVSVRVISLSLRLRLITLTSTLIILDVTKTSSNNCLVYVASYVGRKREVRKCLQRDLKMLGCFVINLLNNKTIILLNLAEYRLILADSAYGLVG